MSTRPHAAPVILYTTTATSSSPVLLRGCGILLVDGDLDLAGGFNWYGTVVVAGKLKSTGNVKIRGAVLTEGDTQIDFIAGSVDLAYCSSATEAPFKYHSLNVLTWKELLTE